MPPSVPAPIVNWTQSPQEGYYINSVAVSADGGTVVGGTFDHTYPTSIGLPRRAPVAAGGKPAVLAAPATSANYGVYCYEGGTGVLRWSDGFAVYEGVYWVAVSADGSRTAAGGNWSESPKAGFVRAYDATNGSLLLDFRTAARVNQVALSADGQWLIAGAESVMLFKLDSTTGQFEKTGGFVPSGPTGDNEVVTVGITASGSHMVFADYAGTISYAANEGGMMAVLKQFTVPNGGFCHMLSLAPDGGCFAAGGGNGEFYMFDVPLFLQSGQPTHTGQTGQAGAVYGVAVAEDGSSFAGVVNTGETGMVHLISITGGVAAPAQIFTTLRNPNCVMLNGVHGLMAVADGHPDGTPGHFYLYSNIGTTATETWRYTTGNMSWPITIAANGDSVIGGSDDSSIYSFPV